MANLMRRIRSVLDSRWFTNDGKVQQDSFPEDALRKVSEGYS